MIKTALVGFVAWGAFSFAHDVVTSVKNISDSRQAAIERALEQ